MFALSRCVISGLAIVALLSAGASSAFGAYLLDAGQLVQAGGSDLWVPGWSVPSFVDWNNDGLPDLIVGDGGGAVAGMVRIYLNEGVASQPLFDSFTYVQSMGADLTVVSEGCQGAYPRVVDWDEDGRKDLIVGKADGTVVLYLNNATDESPAFDGGTLLLVGPAISKSLIDVGVRAAPSVTDWNSDGKKDLVVGAFDGYIHLFVNEGTDASPDFVSESYAQCEGADLLVDYLRSSPEFFDFDGDGVDDLLTGDTLGRLLVHSNIGTAQSPYYADSVWLEADGVPIDLPGTARSRPFICDWTADGLSDILVGSGDGFVYLYQRFEVRGDLDEDGDVDLEDFVIFADCMAGPSQSLNGARCTAEYFDACDFDDDDDVDQADYQEFTSLVTQ